VENGGGCKTVEFSSTQSTFSTVSVFFILHFTNWGGCLSTQRTPPAYGPGLGLYKLIYQSNFSAHVAYGRKLSRGARCLFKVTGTDTEMFVKFQLHAVFPEIRDASEQTDTQTRRSQYFAPPRTCRSPVTIFTHRPGPS